MVVVSVSNALNGTKLLSRTEFGCPVLMESIVAAMCVGPSRLVQFFYCGAPVGGSLKVAASADVELTAVFKDALTEQERGNYLRRLHNFAIFPDSARDHPEIVLAAVRHAGGNLAFASTGCRSDKEIVLAALRTIPRSLQYASKTLRDDRSVVLAAVQSDHRSLQFASDPLRNDKAVVLVAVQRCGSSLGLASKALRSDKDVVLAAVQNRGSSLEFASHALRNDKDIVLAALRSDPASLQFASKALQGDPDIAQVLGDAGGRLPTTSGPCTSSLRSSNGGQRACSSLATLSEVE